MMRHKMTVLCEEYGFVLIPYPMRPGQSPRDILSAYRRDWIGLEDGHSAIPKDVAWSTGCYVEIEAVDQEAARIENDRLRSERHLRIQRQHAAETLAGDIWLMRESLALELALDANLLGKAVTRTHSDHYSIEKAYLQFKVSINGHEPLIFPDAMTAARFIVGEATSPKKRMPELLPTAAP